MWPMPWVGLSPLARGTPFAGARDKHNPSVYPRWRGEHHRSMDEFSQGFTQHYARFIPAGAGNTRTHAQRPTLRPVYPRWRGEHGGKKDAVELLGGLSPLARGTRCGSGCRRCDIGLSPLARGTHLGVSRRAGGPRFIPAGAGNTPLAILGEKRLLYRFIPAGAGNTAAGAGSQRRPAVYPRWRGEHANMGRVI